MVNRGGIHCLQANTCVNWELGNTPTLAVACEIFANEAPYPGRTGKYDECASPNCQDEDIRGLGDNVWYKLAVTTGKTYTLTTRLGSATFTWLYLIDSDGSTELASCIYCRRNPDGSQNNHDMSSTLTYTALATKTIFVKVHGSSWLGDGFTLTVDCHNCPPPPPTPGVGMGRCLPLPDPDGEEGGVDTTQCRGIRLGGVCEVTCDANRGWTGDAVEFKCDVSGGIILHQWAPVIPDSINQGWPVCSHPSGMPEPEPQIDPGWHGSGGH